MRYPISPKLSPTKTHTHLAGTFLLLLFLTAVAAAQTFRGAILGTITDQNGAVVAGAKVTVKNTSTGLERSTTTDDAGNYTVPELPIGPYEVRVEQTGFVASVVANVTVEVASERRVDVKLNVAGTETVVTVATNVQVETTTNTLGGTITTRAAEDLPINGRDFTKFLVMVPGATGDPSGATDSPGSFGLFSANGNRGRANNYLLDGTDMNDGYRNLPAINEAGVFGTPATILPIEAISEAAILSNFEAEYGRNSGAIVNIVTKSGTNVFTARCLNSSATTNSTPATSSTPSPIRKRNSETISSAVPLVVQSSATRRSSISLTKASANASDSIPLHASPIRARSSPSVVQQTRLSRACWPGIRGRPRIGPCLFSTTAAHRTSS